MIDRNGFFHGNVIKYEHSNSISTIKYKYTKIVVENVLIIATW